MTGKKLFKEGLEGDFLIPEEKHRNEEIVERYLDNWKTFRDNKRFDLEKCINDILDKYPDNKNIQEVYIKVSIINDAYSTNIKDTYLVAKTIADMDIDKKLKAGELNLVNEIADEINSKTKCGRRYSFASKYCSFHKPEIYPIYDRDNEDLLYAYQKKCKLLDFKFKRGKLKNYLDYVNIINKYKEIFSLEKFNYKQIDRFNWTYCESIKDSK